MKSLQLIIIFVLGIVHIAISQNNLTPEILISKSIKYHDPKGHLNSKVWTMYFEDSRPDGNKRKAHFHFNPLSYDFELMRETADNQIILKMQDGTFAASLNGRSDYTLEEAKKNRLNEERAVMMRNYYHYLWSLPMKLKDPGTILGEGIKTVDFFGKESLELKVTYTPEVGDDIWYFYFNPRSYALQGYRFYHDESVKDGEYIILDGEVKSKDIRIPQQRKWYTHKEDKFLGEDKLVRIEFGAF